MGNLVTKNEVSRFSLKERGTSTLGGRQVWFDPDVLRLNYDGRGDYLGEFAGTDRVLVVMDNGEFFTTSFDISNHYEPGIRLIEKFRPETVWTAVLDDPDAGYPYIKRFTFDDSQRRQRFVGDDERSKLLLLTDRPDPVLILHFADENRVDLELNAAEYIGVKSYKARGKRLTTYPLASIELPELPEPESENSESFENSDISEESHASEFSENSDPSESAPAPESPHTPSLFDDESIDN